MRGEYEKTRGDLQECGTQSAHRTFQSVSGSFVKKSEQLLYERANELVEHADERGVDGMVFEDLEGIQERMSDDKKSSSGLSVGLLKSCHTRLKAQNFC